MSIFILENREWKITVSSLGAELVSAVRRSDGREFIWDAKPDVWKRHAPILFPLVGKYKNNSSFYEGKEYHMSQHGFARDMEFSVDRCDASFVKLSLCENKESLEKYPFKFRLSVSYELVENRLSTLWEVENTNEKEMFFSIGGHPAFVGSSDTLTGANMVFETESSSLTYNLIGSDGLLGDETGVLCLTDKKAVITEDIFDRDALIFEHTDCKSVSLEENGERIVTVAFDAPLFGIWSATKKGNPFVCIEPWYGRVDRSGFDGTLADREYGNRLEAGEKFSAGYTFFFGQ